MKYASAGQYQKINTHTGVMDADPHRLIQMLFSGALEQIAIAKGCIERGDIAGRGVAIGKAISIVGGLYDSVDKNAGSPGLTENLTSLYEFVTSCLSDANLNNYSTPLDDAIRVLKELQAGWDGIRSEVIGEPARTEPA